MKKLLVVLLVSLGLQTQAQINYCDSLSYSIVIDSTTWTTLTVTGNADGVINMADSIDWNFTACNALTCYTSQGNNPYSFPAVIPTDTVKLCYDAVIYFNSMTYVCNHCDSLVYDFMTDTWMLMNMGNPLAIQETVAEKINDNKVYDLLGREWTCSFANLPKGLYIINNRKVLKTE